MYFQNYRLQKRWLDKFLNSPVSEDPWTCNMVITPKHCFSLNNITFIAYLLITVKRIGLAKVSLGAMQKLKTVC